MSAETPAVAATPAAATVEKIDALTGIRIIAALWVVVFHFRGNLASEFRSYVYIAPVIEYGELGVDLFFTLSGFVIAMVYGRKLSRRWSWPANGRFWWARFIRLWPAYMVVMLVVTIWHGYFVVTGRFDPVAPREFTFGSFLRQVFMVVQWTEPDSDRLTWNGPAWTVSAEVLAYLLFPLLALIVIRWVDRIPTAVLPVLAVVMTTPLIGSAIIRGSLYEPWTWALRIGCCFLAGFVMYFFYERVRNHPPHLITNGVAVASVLVGFLGIIVGFYLLGRHTWGLAVIALFPLLIGFLALDRSWIARVLSTRWFVLGGTISYSVYLVHMPIIEPIWAAQGTWAVMAPGTLGSKLAFVFAPVAVLLGGYALWRWVEEPCRARLKDVWARPGSVPNRVD